MSRYYTQSDVPSRPFLKAFHATIMTGLVGMVAIPILVQAGDNKTGKSGKGLSLGRRSIEQDVPAKIGNPDTARQRLAPPTEMAKGQHPIDSALDLMKQCKDQFAKVTDYSATFLKQEHVGKSLTPVNKIEAKYRVEPFSVYFKWAEPDEGKEIIFVSGMNDDKIISHGTGIAKAVAGAVKLDPDGSMAKKGNRHTVRDAGIGNMIEKMIKRWEFERQYNETEVVINHVKLNETRCFEIVTVHPYPDDGKFQFHTLKVYIDKQKMLPIRMEGYGYPAQAGKTAGNLLESYTYLDLQLNVGLSELDFSPRNPAYNFSRF